MPKLSPLFLALSVALSLPLAAQARASHHHAVHHHASPARAHAHAHVVHHTHAVHHAHARRTVVHARRGHTHAVRTHASRRRHTTVARHTGHHAPQPKLEQIPPAMPDLRSSVAYVVNPETHKVLFDQNASAVHPIASITKLMTGLIIQQSGLPLDERIKITDDDVDRLKYSSSHLPVGTVLTRRDALHLALMASENRAAHALGRTYPGGLSAFVSAMNNKARELGMLHTHYVEPTGLSSGNQSTAKDLAVLASVAAQQPMLREFTTSPGYRLRVGSSVLRFGNTDLLVHRPGWKIALQKTGFINEAGQCLLLHTKMAGRKLIMVFLDSAGRLGRIKDAERMRAWLSNKFAHSDSAVARSD